MGDEEAVAFWCVCGWWTQGRTAAYILRFSEHSFPKPAINAISPTLSAAW